MGGNMTKANIRLPNGTKIIVDGTPEEVAKTVKLMQGGFESNPKRTESVAKPTKKTEAPKQAGIVGRIRELNDDGFFKQQKTLKDIKNGLAEKGHIYPVTSLSPALVRLVRSRELRRLQHNKKWTYVGA